MQPVCGASDCLLALTRPVLANIAQGPVNVFRHKVTLVAGILSIKGKKPPLFERIVISMPGDSCKEEKAAADKFHPDLPRRRFDPKPVNIGKRLLVT